jgi:signal transduction histidine kinase
VPGRTPGSKSWAIRFQPKALVGRPEGYVFTLLCILSIALVGAGDVGAGHRSTIGSFEAIPILAAAWLLSEPLVFAVALTAVLSRLAVWLLGGADAVTVLVQIAVVPFLAVVGEAGAAAVAAARANAERDSVVSRIVRVATSADSVAEILSQVAAGLTAGDVCAHVALIDEQGDLYVAAGDPTPAAIDAALARAVAEGASRLQPGVVAVPMVTAGKTVGVLELDSPTPGRLGENDLLLLEQIAPAVAGAVQRSGALRLADEALQHRVRELSVLLDAARGLASSLDLEVIAATVCRSAAAIGVSAPVTSRRSTILRVTGDTAVVVGEYDEVAASVLGFSFPLHDHPGIRTAFREGRATTARVTDIRGQVGSTLRRLDIRNAACAPVRVGAEVWGVMTLSTRSDYVFTPADARLLQGVADLAGLAIANAELLTLERTRSDQLREHGERMAALDHAKSEFLRLASHELRGPLGVVRGYVSMLAEGSLGDLPAGAQTVMPILTAKLTEISGLIEQMLETARLEDSRLQLTLAAADLRDLVTVAIETVRPLAGRGHRIAVELPEAPVPVRVDGARIHTILTNLLDNAIKYSPGGGRVACRVYVEGSRAAVSIEDQGLGIEPDDMPRLFTRFGRLVTRENSHIAGTGLGLYLARELARMHGGDVRAASTPGEGSTFTLVLPTSNVASAISA